MHRYSVQKEMLTTVPDWERTLYSVQTILSVMTAMTEAMLEDIVAALKEQI